MAHKHLKLPTEADIQALFVDYLKRSGHWDKYPIFSTLNGIWLPTKDRSLRYRIMARMRAQGARKGTADLFVLVPRNGYHGLVMELKRRDGGHGVTHEQEVFLNMCHEQGYLAVAPIGFDETMATFKEYMGFDD